MGKVFKIEGSNLIITEGSVIVTETPKRDVFFINEELNKGNVQLKSVHNTVIGILPLTECYDHNEGSPVQFTDASFRAFSRENLGKSEALGGSGAALTASSVTLVSADGVKEFKHEIDGGYLYIYERTLLPTVEAWVFVSKTNKTGSVFSTSLTTGVGSFHLGDAHSIGSAGQNVVFKNESSDIAFFPLWQGQSTNGVTLYEPSARSFGAQVESEPNGALMPSSTPIPYDIPINLGTNVSFTKIKVMPADTSVTGGVWSVSYDVGNIEIARVDIPSWTAGVELSIQFEYPLDIRSGEALHTRITRNDNGLFMMSRGGGTAQTIPWRRTTSRVFEDSEVINASQHIHPDESGNASGLSFDAFGKLQFGFGGNNLWAWDIPTQVLRGRAGAGMEFDAATTSIRMYDDQYYITTGAALNLRLDISDSSSRLMGPNSNHGFRAHNSGASMVVGGSGAVRVGCTVDDAFLISPNGTTKMMVEDTQAFVAGPVAGRRSFDANSTTTTVRGGAAGGGYIALTQSTFVGNLSYAPTSDKRKKTAMQVIPDTLLDAWDKHVKFGSYQMLDSLETSHAGVFAQDIQAAFEEAGMDWEAWGIIVVGEDDFYHVSYNDVIAIEAALMRRTTERMEARLTALEAK
jgi:hypothetical protein